MTNNEFIEQIGKCVKKYAYVYGIEVHSPIIAQAILESGWGKSGLASKYHNYFGLKCGSSWKGKSVNMATKEEYKVGTLTNIRDNFRVYDSMDAGIKGYFDFINTSRYANLKGVKSPEEYVRRIKADGYATSSKYVDNIMRVIRDNKLTRFDDKVGGNMKKEELTGKVLSGKEIINILAKRVINGDYGTGVDRKEKLGELYPIVQKRVNELC
ncbi:MAG: glucosaminidase domain-containing protein [Caryophanon sp.]|nr:glucosaminidase domain-containing protein [Caryophanon sp.]